MELHSRVFKVALASAIGLFAVIGSQAESRASGYRYLCTSVPKGCEYAPPTAPVLQTDVCWSGTAAYVMPQGGCPTGQNPYYIESGEVVSPGTGEVVAYVPLDDACDLGYCVVKPPGAGPTQPGVMCCDGGDCDMINVTDECGGDIVIWCAEGEIAVQGEDGEWVCYEQE